MNNILSMFMSGMIQNKLQQMGIPTQGVNFNDMNSLNDFAQKILDMMCNQETQRLRTELAEARVIAQNNQQTNELIARLAQTPQPGWIVSSPYQNLNPTATASNG